MNKIQCSCFAAVIFLNFYSGICKPVVQIDEEILFDPHKPILAHANNSLPVDINDFNDEHIPLNVTQKKGQKSRKHNSTNTKPKIIDKTDQVELENIKEVIQTDESQEHRGLSIEERISRPNEEDKENEKFCEELCSSCGGSENVFDIAEPSCFCKVETVKSVKCLEDKVTEDILLKVIAYVETDPKSEEEKRVSEYLKQREELSLNRNRRCCGNVGATGPKKNLRQINNSKNQRVYESCENEDNQMESASYQMHYVGKQLRAPQNNRQLDSNEDDNDEDLEEQYPTDEETEEDMLAARKIKLGPGMENLWRKALRAEDTSPEREEESLEDPKNEPVQRKKKDENRHLYKYEPPAGYKAVLGQKQKETSKSDGTGQQQSKQSHLGISKTLKSAFKNTAGEGKQDLDESSLKKPKKSSTKSEKQLKTNEKPLEEEKKSIKELISEQILQTKKKSDDILKAAKNVEPRKNSTYKSLDDILYEQELKRQKILSSVWEKYAKNPEPTSKLSRVDPDEQQEDDVVIKSKNKKKKYSENNARILGSKKIDKFEKTNLEIPSQGKEEEHYKKESSARLKFNVPKYENVDENLKVNKKHKKNKSLEDSEIPNEEKTPNGQLLGEKRSKGLSYPGKQIVSPFIDERYKKSKDSESLNLKTPKSEEGSSAKLKFRTNQNNKEYLEKDNELGKTGINKESISSLISKIRAKYEKNERDVTKAKEKSKLGSKNSENAENTKVLSNLSPKYKDGSASEKVKDNKNFVLRGTNEKIHEDKKPFFKGQNINPKYVVTIHDENGDKNDRKYLKNQSYLKGKSTNANHSMKPGQSIGQSDEKNSERSIVDKYLKAKYSGVKPSLIQDEKFLLKKKTLNSRNADNKKDASKINKESSKDDELGSSYDEYNIKDALKNKYLQKKEELLQKIGGRESERSNSKSVLGKQLIAEIQPPQENTEDEDDEIKHLDEQKVKEALKTKYLKRKEELLQKIAEREHERSDSKSVLGKQKTAETQPIEVKPQQENTEDEDDEIEHLDEQKVRDALKTKYLKRKEELLQKIAEREHERSDSKPVLGKQKTAETQPIEIQPPQENTKDEDDDFEHLDEQKVKDALKTKYLKRKEELLQKIAEREHERSDPKPVLKKQIKTATSRSIEINPPKEIKSEKVFSSSSQVFPGTTREERKKILETALRELTEKNKNAKPINSKQQQGTIVGISNNNAKKSTTKEEERKLLENRVEDAFEETPTNPKLCEKKNKHRDEEILGLSQDSDPADLDFEEISDETTQPVLKKLPVKEIIEQKLASKLESVQIKSNERNSNGKSKKELLKEKEVISSKQETPTKLSLKELIDQRKIERQNALERSKLDKESKQKFEKSNNDEIPVVSSSLNSNNKDVQTIMDQNPQKHCEQCMKYINRMSQLQREQILGQKPYSTRSISSKLNQNVDIVETEDEVAQEKFLSCRCYENQNDDKSKSGSMLGQVNPTTEPSNDAMLGQPFNMKDVSQAFENIKTGIESSVKGANDKIAKGFNDMKTTLENEYDQVSHSKLAENLKDTTKQVSQKISKELSDVSHSVQNKYDSVTHKEIDGNMKDMSDNVSNIADKGKSELHNLTDGVVSQAAPNKYITNSQIIIPADQLRTKYAQAKYINLNQKVQPQASPLSGNANAPINQV